MKRRIAFTFVLLVICVFPALAQAPRQDAIWARKAVSNITLDGNLTEYDWSRAESMSTLIFGRDAGVPGSGWKIEAGRIPSDTVRATLKFLVKENQLYLGARIQDKSVGGSKEFNRFDGLLMALKDHSSPDAPKPPAEYFYAWWYAEGTDPQPPGQSPAFIGRWANWPPGSPRTPEQIDAWDARTIVRGLSNSDATLDTDYTIEMRFNLTPMGYNVTDANGDIVEWNVSVYDTDWFWPFDGTRFSSSRVWWQGPWGNAAWYSEVRIHARPDIDIYDVQLPTIEPEYVVPHGNAFGEPVINGRLDDAVWAQIKGFMIQYGNDVIRQSYPAVGPDRAGQYQPEVNGGLAAVLDPGPATVKMFFRGQFLYLGFSVLDQVVQYHANFDRWDGFIVSINHVTERSPDQNLAGKRLTFQVGPDGQAIPQDDLLDMVNAGKASVAITLNPGTVIDTLGFDPDTGYNAELRIDLTGLGYPPDLGDGTLHIGIDMLDGDSFIPPSDSYGTRTWWFREYQGTCCPVWAYMDPDLGVTGAPEAMPGTLIGDGQPNPFRDRTTIRYAVPSTSVVTLEIYDVLGRLVREQRIGSVDAGEHEAVLEGSGLAAGVYAYRLSYRDAANGESRGGTTGRLVRID